VRPALLALVVVATAGSICEPPPPPPPAHDPCAEIPQRYGDGRCDTDCAKPDPDCCFIGDPAADADIQLIYRNADGHGFTDLHDGDRVPLILPPQGGKVTLVGIRAKNVSCRLNFNAGLIDDCQDPSRVIGREGRPLTLVEGEDGYGIPEQPDTLQNYANIPVCPTFSSSRDGDEQPYHLELRVTEVLRDGEAEPRTHVFEATVTPFCAEPDIAEDCRCECDADFVTSVDRTTQCPTINDNDPAPTFCAPDDGPVDAGP
jgi:hypothetical protein